MLAAEGMPAEIGRHGHRWWLLKTTRDAVSRAWDDQVERLQPGTRRTGRTAVNMDRARDLLWSHRLTPAQTRVWALYCDGASEATIGKAVRRSREFLLDHVLGMLETLCGIRTRPFTQCGRVNARKRRRASGAR